MGFYYLFLGFVATCAYDYKTSGDDWSGLCSTGKSQSPVDILDSDSTVVYDSSPISIFLDFGTSIKGRFAVNSSGGFGLSESYGTIYINSYLYNINNIHFHSPAEHFINGKQNDLEVHLVGRSEDNYFQVVAILFSVESDKPNEFIQSVINKYYGYDNSSFDTSWLICDGEIEDYYHYKGSLTAPIYNDDCAENVTWTIMRQTLSIGADQLSFFKNLWKDNPDFANGNGNNRKLQNINGREIYLHPAQNIRDKVCEAKSCPIVEYSSKENEECYSIDNSKHTLADCKNGYYCPATSFYYANESYCAKGERPVSERQYYLFRGNSTTACEVSNDCVQQMYCENSSCQLKKSEQSSCSLIDECEDGYICNEKLCIKYLSIKTNESAEYSLACGSGILLNGKCQVPQLTIGDMPKQCLSNKDCLASDGVTEGSCSCVFDSKGSSFCQLHRSDSLALKHLIYAHEGKPELADYYTKLYNMYPIQEKTTEESFEYYKELIELKQSEKYSFALRVIGAVALLLG